MKLSTADSTGISCSGRPLEGGILGATCALASIDTRFDMQPHVYPLPQSFGRRSLLLKQAARPSNKWRRRGQFAERTHARGLLPWGSMVVSSACQIITDPPACTSFVLQGAAANSQPQQQQQQQYPAPPPLPGTAP
eukprot:scaffold8740_cov20-Tisochrysis_lutea.AAC.1